MLIIAGILFVLAMLAYFIDKWFDNGSINLMWLYRILLFLSLVFMAIGLWAK